ncbi:MAG: hypothetical protein AYK22_08215 [Thermoplasmatales archaeon SG8-52-3]|nr:MAG: hypothetical protein AYK22_08215 [Thermoplasmatales archaeon SG8-52-3]
MKKKIVGIFVCTLLIATSIPVIGIRSNEMNNPLSVIVENIQVDKLPLLSGNDNYEIIRDDYGVPHVYADTKDGLAFGMGYAIAEDRLWQLDLLRRQTTGRLAEFDLATVEDDLFMRTIGHGKDEVKSIYDNVSSPLKEMYASFVDGINQYIDEALADPDNKMPAEYIEYGLLPEYFTVFDICTVGIMASKLWGEYHTGEELFHLIKLFGIIRQNGVLNGWKIFNDLCPINDPGAVTTLDGDYYINPQNIPKLPPFYSPIVLKLAEKIIEKIESFNKVSNSLGLLNHFGSNAWVVSPEKSSSGNTLLLGGPQMGYSIPQQVVEIGLHGAGMDVVGVTIPGIGPLIIQGVSQWTAWAGTTGNSDLVDTYIERLHPLNKLKYKFKGSWHNMDTRTEIIYDSKGEVHEYDLHRTVHGPVLGSFWFPIIGGFAITRKEPDIDQIYQSFDAWGNLPACKNVSEIKTQLKGFLFSNNFLFADRYGNIGYYHTGWYPIRPDKKIIGRRLDRRFPLMGTGNEEWQGILPFDQNPQGINPSEGFYANWNNKPRPNWSYSEGIVQWQQGGWGENVRRVQELLEADDSITIEDMVEICKNVAYHEPWATCCKPYLMDAIDNVGGIPSEVVTALENWDCYYNDVNSDGYYDDPGVTIFTYWILEMINQTLRDEIPGDIAYWEFAGLILHILQGDDSPLELKYKNYFNGIPRNEMIINVLENVLIKLKDGYGTSNVSEWLFPIYYLTEYTPIFDEIGSLKSPEKLGYYLPLMNRGTYNQIVEMPNWEWSNTSDPPIGINVLPCGQSGFVKYPDIISPHAYDQLDLYLNWEFKSMLFNLTST